MLGRRGSVHNAAWPAYDESMIADQQITIVIQVNGKLRDRLEVPAGIDDESLRQAARANEKVRSAAAERPIQDIIVVPGRLVNVVV